MLRQVAEVRLAREARLLLAPVSQGGCVCGPPERLLASAACEEDLLLVSLQDSLLVVKLASGRILLYPEVPRLVRLILDAGAPARGFIEAALLLGYLQSRLQAGAKVAIGRPLVGICVLPRRPRHGCQEISVIEAIDSQLGAGSEHAILPLQRGVDLNAVDLQVIVAHEVTSGRVLLVQVAVGLLRRLPPDCPSECPGAHARVDLPLRVPRFELGDLERLGALVYKVGDGRPQRIVHVCLRSHLRCMQ